MDTTGNQPPPGAGATGPPDRHDERLARERRGRSIAVVLVVILALFLGMSITANFLLLALAGGRGGDGTGGRVRERVVMAGGKEKVAVIPLQGVILTKESSAFGEGTDMVSKFHEQLDRASGDEKVRGVILEINSPGGSVTPSDIMYHDLVAFKKRHGARKPVVTLMKDVTASGGYYVAAPSDWIVAHPTTIAGSIGVYMGYMRLEKLFTKLGVEEELIKSGPHKDMGSPFRRLTDEERAIIKGMVTVVYDRFKSVVQAGRGDKVKARFAEATDGRVFIGTQAKEMGLVDEIGYLEEAVVKTASLAGVKAPTVVRYSTRVSVLESLMSEISGVRPPALHELMNDPYCGLMYLWRPGVQGKDGAS